MCTKRTIILVLGLIITLSHISAQECSADIEETLAVAGANCGELQSFLRKYKKSGDTEKYTAACFLVANMKRHLLGGKVLHYDKRIDDLISSVDASYYTLIKGHSAEEQEADPLHASIKTLAQKTSERIKGYSFEEPDIIAEDLYDAEVINAEFLSKHLEHAFYLRKNNPRVKALPFDIFCSYILPYRAFGDYPLVNTSSEFSKIFQKYLSPYQNQSADNLAACYNRTLWWLRRSMGQYPFDTMLGFPEVFFTGIHDCVDIANYCTLIFRSCGIPAVVEGNICRRFSPSRHFMTTFLDNTNKWQTFSPESELPSSSNDKYARTLNVYRYHFESVLQSPSMLKAPGEPLPASLEDEGLEDVSSCYINVVSLSLPLDTIPSGRNLAYLAVSGPTAEGLIPVTWGTIYGDSVRFSNVVKDEVYFPVYLDSLSHFRAFAEPFLIEEDSIEGYKITNISDILPQSETEKCNVCFIRKYPQRDKVLRDAELCVGTYILGSDVKNFAQADTLAVIEENPGLEWGETKFTPSHPYRYYRVQAPANDPHLHFGELQFFRDGKRVLDEPLEKCKWKAEYDGNISTAPDRWPNVTLSLSEPQVINDVRYIIKQEDLFIVPTHYYSLEEWTSQGWQQVCREQASEKVLTFQGLNVGGLYKLTDLSTNQVEMPFLLTSEGTMYNPYNNLLNKYNP